MNDTIYSHYRKQLIRRKCRPWYFVMLVNSCDVAMQECLRSNDQNMYDLIKETRDILLEYSYIDKYSYEHDAGFAEKVEDVRIYLQYDTNDAEIIGYVQAHVEHIDVSLVQLDEEETANDFIDRADVNHYFEHLIQKFESYYGDYYTSVIKAICKYVAECKESQIKIIKKRVSDQNDFSYQSVLDTWALCEKYDFDADTAVSHVWEFICGT